jgi:hypothetical protein
MKLNEIRNIAKLHNLKVGKATKCELVRAIQQAEGHQQCFDSNYSAVCGQNNCAWREDCD